MATLSLAAVSAVVVVFCCCCSSSSLLSSSSSSSLLSSSFSSFLRPLEEYHRGGRRAARNAPADLVEANDWNAFKNQYRKVYPSILEEEKRRQIFTKNRKYVAEHNLQLELKKGIFSYDLKINSYSDLDAEEFNRELNSLRSDLKFKSPRAPRSSWDPEVKCRDDRGGGNGRNSSVNWGDRGAVTGVKNQGHCGSCWAFSATGALEGMHFLNTGKLVPLSEQNLVDCSYEQGNEGCCGGLMTLAFDYVIENEGISTEESYPYIGKKRNCQSNGTRVDTFTEGYVELPVGNETALEDALACVGPVSIGIDASNEKFHFYSSGVFTESGCPTSIPNHGMLVVGYGTDEDSGLEYWLLKNSWGVDWGERGYMRLARNRGNLCAVASLASYPYSYR